MLDSLRSRHKTMDLAPTSVSDPFDTPRMWRRSFLLAAALHSALFAILLNRSGLLTPVDLGALSPLVEGELVEAGGDVAMSASNQSSGADPGGGDDTSGGVGTAVEPDRGTIEAAARTLLSADRSAIDPAAYEKLVQKAKLLEQISTPEEVRRMSERLREALGVSAFPEAATDPARPINFDRAQLVSSERVERDGRVEIRERMTDADGATAEIVYVRRIDHNGRTVYEQVYIEAGRPPVVFASSKQEFDEAAARQKPFEVINRFPLLQTLHRQAVIPLMDKLTAEDAATSQPGGTDAQNRASP